MILRSEIFFFQLKVYVVHTLEFDVFSRFDVRFPFLSIKAHLANERHICSSWKKFNWCKIICLNSSFKNGLSSQNHAE